MLLFSRFNDPLSFISKPLFFVYSDAIFEKKELAIVRRLSYNHTQTKPLPGNLGKRFLTTYLTITSLGTGGNSGGKSAGKHLFPSGKGRTRPEISGNRYSQILWDSVEK